jgi:hypothetical protein
LYLRLLGLDDALLVNFPTHASEDAEIEEISNIV